MESSEDCTDTDTLTSTHAQRRRYSIKDTFVSVTSLGEEDNQQLL